MFRAAQTTSISNGASAFGSGPTLDAIIRDTEAAEFDLAVQGANATPLQRKQSGSYYTPADVADHTWNLFFRFHHITGADSLRAFIARTHFVEPSAGSGIFVFTFVRKALAIGLQPIELTKLRFSVVDVNLAALRFVGQKIGEVESSLGVSLSGIGLVQRDFLDWAGAVRSDNLVFVGNPPFVSNARGSRWRNLYADFLQAILAYPAQHKSACLILPVSVCFSRDYVGLRQLIDASGMGVSASSYDNIPDSLFKAGKPESTNTNRANSQRCTILNLGGPDSKLREAAPLRRWATAERQIVLSTVPEFQSYSAYRFDAQIPRPASPSIMNYLSEAANGLTIRSLLTKCGKPHFAVAGVARNYIGIRDADGEDGSAITIRAVTNDDRLMLLQILGSDIFYEYWRTVGDGFHVTNDLIERFPISALLKEVCLQNLSTAESIWEARDAFAKEKLNSGKVIRSYDFRRAFSYLACALPSG